MAKKFLLIDDSEDVEFQVRNCAAPLAGELILELYDPRCGIPEKTFNWSHYDLVLLDFDLGLPKQNGLEWLKQFRRNPKMPPVIMLTGYGTKKLAAEAMAQGASAFLEKDSLTPQLFADTVTAVLAQHCKTAAAAGPEKTQLFRPEDLERIKARPAPLATPVPEAQEFEQTRAFSGAEIASLTGKQQAVSPPPAPAAVEATASRQVTGAARAATAGTRRSPPAHRKGGGDVTITVPGYTVISKIGEGGMASIYLAERDEDKLKVVLKILSMQGSAYDPALLRRFMREYKLIAQIQHPNIVQIYERAFASSFAYIAMEYFGYGDLAEKLKLGLDAKTAINYLHQIAEGLGAAHAQGIVHRDMKPANILFRSPDSLAITDFGIAKNVEADNVSKQLTMDGELMGTLYYISPEQIQGAEADQRSDIYSLGVIMYKMLTGKHPFVGASPTEVFEAHLHSPIPALPPNFASLQPLLDGLLAKDPDERFQSTDDLLMGLNWQEWA